ncbi:MAG: 1,2-phenylacetyl-CoA epoxidase subunit PaaC [Chloroflexota bacterium]
MNSYTPNALTALVLALADDELILGHRNSEWTGHAPILEEDIAFSNIAQDELGHAILWYRIFENLTSRDSDYLVFFREARDFSNVQMMELPKGDWAFTIMRQYLFDAFEMTRLKHLTTSSYQPIADAAAKIRTEEIYHYRHTVNWVKRLGLGTEESHRRMQTALDQVWAYALQLFVPLPDEAQLVAEKIFPNSDEVKSEWEAIVLPVLKESNLIVPATRPPACTSREQHTEHLTALLVEMQETARLESPDVKW